MVLGFATLCRAVPKRALLCRANLRDVPFAMKKHTETNVHLCFSFLSSFYVVSSPVFSCGFCFSILILLCFFFQLLVETYVKEAKMETITAKSVFLVFEIAYIFQFILFIWALAVVLLLATHCIAATCLVEAWITKQKKIQKKLPHTCSR